MRQNIGILLLLLGMGLGGIWAQSVKERPEYLLLKDELTDILSEKVQKEVSAITTSTIIWGGISGGALTIIWGLGAFALLRKEVKNQVLEKTKQEVDREVEKQVKLVVVRQISQLQVAADQARLEMEIKERQFYLVYKKKSLAEKVAKVLHQFSVPPENILQLTLNQFLGQAKIPAESIIILADQDSGDFKVQKEYDSLLDTLKPSPKSILVWYGPQGCFDRDLKVDSGRFSMANTTLTLYARIIEAVRIQEMHAAPEYLPSPIKSNQINN